MLPQPQHRQLLNRLSVEQLQEALVCLHQDQSPQDPYLQNLSSKEWSLLHDLLVMLFQEKKLSSLH
jgi:hypothetical protein